MGQHKIIVAEEKCIGCKLCAKDCLPNNLEIRDGKAKVLGEHCLMCGHCVAVCPNEAISITGFDTEPEAYDGNARLNPDEVLRVIRFRRTVRQFQNKEVSSEILDQILEAGRMSHTGANAQDVAFVVLNGTKAEAEALAVKKMRRVQKMIGAFNKTIKRVQMGDHFLFFEAPLVIVITGKSKVNASLAAQNMEFVAEAHGLGTLYSGFFSMCVNTSRKLKKLLGLEKGQKVVTTLVMGYPKVKFLRGVQREKLKVKYR